MSSRQARMLSYFFGASALTSTAVLGAVSVGIVGETVSLAESIEKMSASGLLALISLASVYALVKIHKELVQQGTTFIAKLDELKDEFHRRPCFYEHKDNTK